jgi:hypothetical protein
MASNTQIQSAVARKGIQTTTNPLSEDYLRWLEPQIRDDGNQGRSYWDLLRTMYEKEFKEFVPNDDNRIVDGLDLRVEFCHTQHIRLNSLKNLGPCTFLEVLIGLSRRLAFAAGGTPVGWAWQLVINLELHKMFDQLSHRKVNQVNDILNGVIDRTYQPDGYGGFFPLVHSDEDQTGVELWYQMAAYIDEMYPEN